MTTTNHNLSPMQVSEALTCWHISKATRKQLEVYKLKRITAQELADSTNNGRLFLHNSTKERYLRNYKIVHANFSAKALATDLAAGGTEFYWCSFRKLPTGQRAVIVRRDRKAPYIDN